MYYSALYSLIFGLKEDFKWNLVEEGGAVWDQGQVILRDCFCLTEKKVWGRLLAMLSTALEMLEFIFKIFVELFGHGEYLEIIIFL